MTLKFNIVLEVAEILQNVIKLSAAAYELSC